MPEVLNFFGFQLNAYGLIIGLSIYLGLYLVEKRIKEDGRVVEKISEDLFVQISAITIISAIFGARIWHVCTDFYLYRGDIFAVFKIWQGGLSIFGAILGGVFGMLFYLWWRDKNFKKLLLIADLSIFGMPIGQAMGRFGNYVNQELYGAPTNLPWKIFIDPEKRVAGYEQYAHFHPLFLYESLLMLFFGMGIWIYDNNLQKKDKIILGKGKYFIIYLIFYGVVRFFLDFLRIDNAKIIQGLGINQLVILFFLILIMSFLAIKNRKNLKLLTFFTVTIFFMIISTNYFQIKNFFRGEVPAQSTKQNSDYKNLQKVADRQLLLMTIGDKKLNVEVVNNEASRSLGLSGRNEIGADGMLFVFPQKSYQQFWMKDMKFNLDFIWIADGKVVEIMRDVPRPEAGQSLEALPRFIPRQPVEMMLEVVAGDAERWGVVEGDLIGVVRK